MLHYQSTCHSECNNYNAILESIGVVKKDLKK